MLKTTLFFIIVLLCTSFTFAQIGNEPSWAWIKGDNTINQYGVYGVQGTSDSLNKPGSRNFSVTWKDNDGLLWLYGGYGKASSTTGYLNDLWKYNPYSNVWTWMKGDSAIDQVPVYGTMGVANSGNKPGTIYNGLSWTDASGNLWLFGGLGNTSMGEGFLNSLWKYNPASNQWTWVKGDNAINNTGTYGIRGIGSIANNPGARYGSLTWTDANGQLWLLGGNGYDAATAGLLNDLWKYDPATNMWTWVNGDNTVDQKAVYGTKGLADNNNKPGARYGGRTWKDLNGNLWLFGGYGFDDSFEGILNDLWKYNSLTNTWTWINGDNTVNQTGIYGSQGIPSASNKPGARYVGSSWTDAVGDLWLFGGYGHGAVTAGYLNDLWKYKIATNEWTWIKGDNTTDQLSIYGTQGMADPSNETGSRTGSVSWTDGVGSLWLFGGYGYDGTAAGALSDLWKINGLQIILPVNLLVFKGVLNSDAAKLEWKTEKEVSFSHFNLQRSFDGINFSTISRISGRRSNSASEYVYYDNEIRNFSAQKIFYRLQLVNNDGHTSYSKTIRFDRNELALNLHVFPNPAVETLTLSFNQDRPGIVRIRITDMNGKTIKQQEERMTMGKVSINIDVSHLMAGTYVLSLIDEKGFRQQKFIK
jgi:hypothetical protein